MILEKVWEIIKQIDLLHYKSLPATQSKKYAERMGNEQLLGLKINTESTNSFPNFI